MIICRDRSAEHALRRRQNLQSASARSRPPTIVLGHPANGDQPLDFFAEGCRKTVDNTGATAAVVDVVAGHDEEEALSVWIGTALRVDAADHLADLPLDRGVGDRRRIG